MLKEAVKPQNRFNYSKLFRDFLQNEGNINKYVNLHGPVQIASDMVPNPKIDRGQVCDILFEQNKDFLSKSKTFDNIERLRDEKAVCLFTGQQSGLLGGPLLTFYKAIDVIKRAALLEQELHRPVIPMFWIACDDHDFQEVNHTFSIDNDNNVQRISYELSDDSPVAIAEVALEKGKSYDDFKRQTKEAFGGTDFSDELLERLFKWHSPGMNIVEAFAKNMNDILPDLGLVLFCPHNREIKDMSKSFFKEIAERYFSLKERLEETERSLEEDGYHIQAEKKVSAVHLFYHDPGRQPIHYLDDTYHVGDKKLGLTAMLDLIDKFPSMFSPDVLTRPLWQSYLFPTIAQSGGPAEIAYLCQISDVFEMFNLTQPYYYPRAGATVIEKREEELLQKHDLQFTDLLGDIEQTINDIASKSFPKDLELRIKGFKETIGDQYSDFAAHVVKYDKNLEGMAKQTYSKIDYALNKFEEKIFTQHKKNIKNTRNQIYRLRDSLYPNNTFQERTVNIYYFISKYGYDIVEFFTDKIDVSSKDHQLIYLSEFLNR